MKDDTKVTKVKFSPQGGMNGFFVDDHKHPANGSPGICYLFKDKIQWDPQAVLANYLSSLKREHFLHSIMCARVCVRAHMHTYPNAQHSRQPEDRLWEPVLSFHHRGPRDQTWVKFDEKCLSEPSHQH